MRTLHGLNIVVTRPAHQAQSLCEKIRKQGGTPLLFPTIEINPARDQKVLKEIINNLADFDIAIFVSANAVLQTESALKARWPALPKTLKVLAIGQATKNALEKLQIPVLTLPKTFNSESLLELPELQQLKNTNIVIFAGEGGRELLFTTLSQRGASVTKAVAYFRSKPKNDMAEIQHYLKLKAIHAILCTSNEGLENLVNMVEPSYHVILRAIPLVGLSQRLIKLADQLNFKLKPILTPIASEEAILNTLLEKLGKESNVITE